MKWSIFILALAVSLCLSAVPFMPDAEAAPVGWEIAGSMPGERSGFVNAPLPDGRIFMALGYNSSAAEHVLDSWMFDPEDMSWTEVSDSPWGTELSTGACLGDAVYIFGGQYSNYTLVSSVLIYNVTADAWSIGPNAPFEKLNLRCVAMDDHRIFIAGAGANNDECHIFDTNSMSFSIADNLPQGRTAGTLVNMGVQLLYFGGLDSANHACDKVFKYYIDDGYWVNEAYMPEPRMGMSGAWASDGLVYLIGGDAESSWYSANLVDCLAYDTYEGTFIELPDLPEPVRYSAACELEDGRMLCYGGHNGHVGMLNVYSLKIWSVEASLDSETVEQGESAWLSVQVLTNFAPMGALTGYVFLTANGTTYATFDFLAIGNTVVVEIPISENAIPLDYLIVLKSVEYNYKQNFEFDDLPLTVTEAPSIDDRLNDLQERNDELQDQLNDTQEELEELKGSLEGKMDTMVGYVILILVLVTLAVGVVVMVRKK